MEILNIILLFVGFVWSYKKTKDLFNPYVIFCGIWFSMLFLFKFYPHELYPLSNDFHLTMFLWIISFSIVPVIYTNSNRYHKRKFINCPIPENKNALNYLYNISIVIMVLQLFVLVISGALSGNFYEKLIHETQEKNLLEVIFDYLQKLPLVLCGFLFWNKNPLYKKKKYYLFILILVSLILMAGKTKMTQFLIMILFLSYLYKTVNIKKIAILAGCFFILFSSLQLFRIQDETRKEDFELSEFFLGYTLSSLPAMDCVIHDKSKQVDGGTFRFPRVILEKTGIISPYKSKSVSDDGWVFVPIATNVYTVLLYVYSDYKNTGVFIYGFILGLFWIVVYHRVNRGRYMYILFYGAVLYVLIMQFFDDIMLSYTSDIIQYFFWSWLIIKIVNNGRYFISHV